MPIRRLAAILVAAALATPAAADTIYGVKSLSGGAVISQAPAVLYSFSDTGAPNLSSIGTILRDGLPVDVDAIALSTNFGLLGYELAGTGAGQTARLISIDTATAVATPIGGFLTGRDIRGAMFDGADRLWAIDATAGSLLRIDPTSGAILSEATITVGGNPRPISAGADLAQLADGSVLLSTYRFEQPDATAPSFFSLDLATGAATLVATDPTPDPANPLIPVYNSGLAAGSTGDRIFTVDGDANEDIFSYDLPGFSRTLVAANILPAFNAGGGDLASLPVGEPISLALFAAGLAGLGAVRRRA